jgi:hypothetical protein
MRFHHTLRLFMAVVFILVGINLLPAKAQEKVVAPKDSAAKAETSTPVAVEKSDSLAPDTTDQLAKALDDFHQILAPLWHEAYPKKDFKSIREKAPLFQEKLFVLLRVKPPTNLEKEKLESYLKNRQDLAFYVSQVNVAAEDTVDTTLASAFEQMHKAYEELVKVFTVEIEALDSFHETLYYIWHKALPAKDYDAIKKTVPVLKAQVDSVMNASLPYACKEMKEEFEKKKTALKDAVYQLALVCQKGTNQQIEEGLNLMHEKFMELNSVLK